MLGQHRNTARYQARPRRAVSEVERTRLAFFNRHARLGQPSRIGADGVMAVLSKAIEAARAH
jgi:hypothetical protein